MLLTHAGPNVGVDSVSSFHVGGFCGPLDTLVLRMAVTFRTDDTKFQTGKSTHVPQRAGHIVPITDVNKLLAGKRRPDVGQREKVGERLAWMFVIAEPVDHGHRSK